MIPNLHFQPIRVLLVDDHDAVRNSLNALLSLEPDIEIVGQAADGESAVAMARSVSPDVILMDVSMPRMNGIEATQRIVNERHDVDIVGLSSDDYPWTKARMLSAGARCYVVKGGPTEELLAAIRESAGAGRMLAGNGTTGH